MSNKDDGFLAKNKKSNPRFKNNKRKFKESAEMQDNRKSRINFKNYLREIEEHEAEDDIDDLVDNED